MENTNVLTHTKRRDERRERFQSAQRREGPHDPLREKVHHKGKNADEIQPKHAKAQ